MKRHILITCAFAAACVIITGCGMFGTSSPTLPDVNSAISVLTNFTAQAQQGLTTISNAYAQYQATAAAVQNIGQQAECVDGSCGVKAVPVLPAQRAAAVICGLTKVDPKKYGGWDGACPGTDVDAQSFAIACQSEGVPYELLLNEKASYIGVVASAKRAVATLKAGDLLILYVSGHGGQTPDPNEADGKSETICLWDGQLVDDSVWALLQQVKGKGIRVWMITDTCNSGTNYRSPHNYAKALAPRIVPGDPILLHWGGCADGKSSFGSAQGGTFTTALVDSYKAGQTYAAWFDALKRRMPFTQSPTFEITGADFQSLPAFR